MEKGGSISSIVGLVSGETKKRVKPKKTTRFELGSPGEKASVRVVDENENKDKIKNISATLESGPLIEATKPADKPVLETSF